MTNVLTLQKELRALRNEVKRTFIGYEKVTEPYSEYEILRNLYGENKMKGKRQRFYK